MTDFLMLEIFLERTIPIISLLVNCLNRLTWLTMNSTNTHISMCINVSLFGHEDKT